MSSHNHNFLANCNANDLQNPNFPPESNPDPDRVLADKNRRLQSAPPNLYSRSWESGESPEPDPDELEYSNWRKFRESVFGRAPYITEKLIGEMKSPNLVILVDIIQSILFAVSNTIFVENPLCGIIILSAMSYAAPKSVFLGLVTLISGLISSLIVRLPKQVIKGGAVTFNCFLLGSLLAPLAGGLTNKEVVKLIPFCAPLGLLIIFIWVGMNGILSTLNLPVLNSPCNLLAILLVFSGILHEFKDTAEIGAKLAKNVTATESKPTVFYSPEEIRNMNHTMRMKYEKDLMGPIPNKEQQDDGSRNCDGFDWTSLNGVFTGIVLSQGRIFQTGIEGSLIIYISTLLYSPIMFFQEILGASIGTVIGIFICGHECEDVYNGSWGYNPLLTASALGGLFIAFNFQSWMLSIIASVFTTFIYAAMNKTEFPIIGIPFQITMWLFLPIATVPKSDEDTKNCFVLQRVTVFSTPENNMIGLGSIGFGLCKHQKVKRVKYHRPRTPNSIVSII